MTADEKFASRWSRLKKEARQTEEKPPQPKPAPEAAAATLAATKAQPAGAPAAPELPSIDSLKGLASEYSAFLKPGVDESLKRSALKKLFADPYFETFEKFEAYCEDYTQGEPIPAAMLRTLEHAKGLLFDEKDEKEEEKAREVDAAEAPAPGQDEAKADAPEAPQPQPEKKT
jgi:uncharacterized protein DUF3306